MDKDLRTLLGENVRGPFNFSYCGEGSLSECRASLWDAVDGAADRLAARLGEPDPDQWLGRAARTGFEPGLLSRTFPATNRPTFQQVLELERRR